MLNVKMPNGVLILRALGKWVIPSFGRVAQHD